MLTGSSTCCELYCTDTDTHDTLCTLSSCSFTRGHKTHGVFQIIIIIFYVVLEGSKKPRRDRVSDYRIIQRIRVLRMSRGSRSSMPSRPHTQIQCTHGRRRTLCDIASREILRNLLRCSCGSLSPRQAIQSTASGFNIIKPAISTIGKCWLAVEWRTNLSENLCKHLRSSDRLL